MIRPATFQNYTFLTTENSLHYRHPPQLASSHQSFAPMPNARASPLTRQAPRNDTSETTRSEPSSRASASTNTARRRVNVAVCDIILFSPMRWVSVQLLHIQTSNQYFFVPHVKDNNTMNVGYFPRRWWSVLCL